MELINKQWILSMELRDMIFCGLMLENNSPRGPDCLYFSLTEIVATVTLVFVILGRRFVVQQKIGSNTGSSHRDTMKQTWLLTLDWPLY